ncbi:MAG: LSm family protein [Methanobrevibacter sp.]|uniref:LSM domain-containing protein n=1 Tax=Methanobrevibacter sp. TaxID=66852 RepID=UPI0026DF961E|nr:LSm family protein [Methanobrevibacter sp.]MDO5847929.1 LSm family protein [Methanobrevibacter sp.]
MENNEFNVNEQFLAFKGKNVIVGLRNNMECEGTLIAIDNYLNSVIETENGGIQTLKGGEVNFIVLNE